VAWTSVYALDSDKGIDGRQIALKRIACGPMTEPTWIHERDVLAIHDRLLALDGGASGVRDVGLLRSALARPQHLHTYGKHPGSIAMAAAYIAGIVRNHPFVDGNKRTGFLAGILFLELNGCRFTATEASAAQAILSLAAGTLDEPAFVAWLRANTKRIP
jgi:death on curing protein